MKQKTILFIVVMALALAGCGSQPTATVAPTQVELPATATTVPTAVPAPTEIVVEPTATQPEPTSSPVVPTPTEVALKIGKVQVFKYSDVTLHAYATNDALGDECYILETADSLVGIEPPAFTDNLKEWSEYVKSLNKPMKDIFVANHPTGTDYLEGMNVYSTAAAKKAIEGGSTRAILEGLAKTFGKTV